MYTAIVERNKDGLYFFKIYDNTGNYVMGDNSYSWGYVFEMLSDYNLEKVLTDKFPIE